MNKPSVILLGSKPGASVAVKLMLEKGWDIQAIVNSGENIHQFIGGKKLEDIAKENNIPLLMQEDIDAEQVDLVISYMYRNLVKENVLKKAKTAAVNFHAGPLPEFGGWAFYNVAILENAEEYGCTCHHMDSGFDTGPILEVRRFKIDVRNETAWSLEKKAQEEMIRLFIDFMGIIESGKQIPRIEQEKSKMRYMNKQTFESLKEIPINAKYEDIQRIARAFFYPPYQCAYMNINNKKIEVLPELVKTYLGGKLHEDDFMDVEKSARSYKN